MPTSKRNVRKGDQEPSFRLTPSEYDYSDADTIIKLNERYTFKLFPWQKLVLEDWCKRYDDGRLVCLSAGLTVPRQNGKNAILEAFEFGLMILQPGVKILHTSHQVKTNKAAFRRLSELFEKNDSAEIRRMVLRIRRTNGEEAIELKNGSTISYTARSRGSARGFDNVTVVVFDECQELTDEQLEAIMYTLAASKTDRFMVYTGTPPGDTAPGEVFERVRKAALSGDAGGRTCWHEWGVKECPDRDASWEMVLDSVYQANPSMGYVLDIEFTREEFVKSSTEGFARERLGWWKAGLVLDPAIPMATWEKLAIDNPSQAKKGVKYSIGVKFSPDGDHVAIAFAMWAPKRKPHVEVVKYTNISHVGIEPVAQYIFRRKAKLNAVYVDGMSNAAPLVERLKDLHFPGFKNRVFLVNPKIMIEAATQFVDAAKLERFTHYDQEVLNESVRTSSKRPIGAAGGYGFGGISAEPMEAAALAHYGVRKSKQARRGRRMHFV